MKSPTHFVQRMLPKSLTGRLLFFLICGSLCIQLSVLAWVGYLRMQEQMDLILDSHARLFVYTFKVLEKKNFQDREKILQENSSPQATFHVTREKPTPNIVNAVSNTNPASVLYYQKILNYLLPLMRMEPGVYYATPEWDRVILFMGKEPPPNFENLHEDRMRSLGLNTHVESLRSFFAFFMMLWENPIQKAEASLPFNDGSWLVASMTGGESPSFSSTGMAMSLCLQFVTLVLLLFLVIKFFTHPLRMLAQQVQSMNLDMPDRIHVPATASSEVRRMAHGLNALKTRMQKQLKEKMMLLASLSHDLRSPVARMRLEVENMAQHNDVELLQESLDELQDMMNGVIAFARSGHHEESCIEVDIGVFLESLCCDYQEQGAPVHFAHCEPASLTLAPRALKRCLVNIIDNALAYGNSATISARLHPKGYEVVVEDEGLGIAEADMQKVFEPFYRLENSRNKQTGGMGLGLSIARNLAAQNHARIELMNKVQGGLLVRIVFRQNKNAG